MNGTSLEQQRYCSLQQLKKQKQKNGWPLRKRGIGMRHLRFEIFIVF